MYNVDHVIASYKFFDIFILMITTSKNKWSTHFCKPGTGIWNHAPEHDRDIWTSPKFQSPNHGGWPSEIIQHHKTKNDKFICYVLLKITFQPKNLHSDSHLIYQNSGDLRVSLEFLAKEQQSSICKHNVFRKTIGIC
jgi:hypothetical protein